MDLAVSRIVDLALDFIVYMVGEYEVNVDGVEVHHGGGEMDWDWDRNGNVATGNGGEGELVIICFSLHLTL